MIVGPGWMDVKPSRKTALAIQSWATRVCDFIRIEKANELHITQLFIGGDNRYPIVPNKNRSYSCRFNDVALFGDTNGALVLKVTSPSLHIRFREFEKVGYKHTYPSYEPHITLLEGATASDLNTARHHLGKLRELVPIFTVQGETFHKSKKSD